MTTYYPISDRLAEYQTGTSLRAYAAKLPSWQATDDRSGLKFSESKGKTPTQDLATGGFKSRDAPMDSGDPVSSFLRAKGTNLTRSAREISDLIESRVDLRQRNLYAIALGECELMTKLHNLERWYLGIDPVIDKRKAILERELLEFDRQKRMEETAAWKDVLSLRGELRQVVQDLYKEQSRQKILSYGVI